MISILVPTMNRPDFVVRLIEYYARARFPYTLLIGDSSSPKQKAPILTAIEKYRKVIHVEHADCPGMSNYEVMQFLLNKIETPYASYLADDDFLVVDTVREAIAFMESHPDYVGAAGQAMLFQLRDHGPFGEFEAAMRYPQFEILGESAIDRLRAHAQRYTSAFHAVCRTKVLRRALRSAHLFNRTALPGDVSWLTALCFGELATSWSMISQGKLKILDSLYYVRQTHPSRHIFPDWYEWFTSPNWRQCLLFFSAQLIEDLEREGFQPEVARKTFEAAFLHYMQDGLVRYREKKMWDRNDKYPWKDLAKKIPGTKKAWRLWRSFQDEMSLESLLRPSSHHHGRFSAVYDLVSDASTRGES